MNRAAHEASRGSWNTGRTTLNRHKGNQAAFLRAGGRLGLRPGLGRGFAGPLPGARIEPVPSRYPRPAREFICGLDDILGAALGAGLTLERFVDYPSAHRWRGFEGMTPLPGNRWAPPANRPQARLMFGLRPRPAHRPAFWSVQRHLGIALLHTGAFRCGMFWHVRRDSATDRRGRRPGVAAS